MRVYVAINDGGWLDRHSDHRDITETDWWHSPNATTFRGAKAGDLFFVKRKYPNDELFVCGMFKIDYREEFAETAWTYTSKAYSFDTDPRQRAAGVLKISSTEITSQSKVGLIALKDLTWFPSQNRPKIGLHKNIVTGCFYELGDPDFQYLVGSQPNPALAKEAIRIAYLRFTEERLAEILPLHNDMAIRFANWLRQEHFEDVRRERGGIDVRFSRGKQPLMAELKICDGDNTRHAMREAMGQVFEYNHYASRTKCDEWWIVLDRQPTEEDATYVQQLRESYSVPLYLGFEANQNSGEFQLLKL